MASECPKSKCPIGNIQMANLQLSNVQLQLQDEFLQENCLFWSEEVLFKNVFPVFPDFQPNRFRKTGCFHPGQILGPRWDQWHLKHGDWSSQSTNSSLTLLLFIKDTQLTVLQTHKFVILYPCLPKNVLTLYSIKFARGYWPLECTEGNNPNLRYG